MGKTSLRVMFINLENLFSPGDQFYGSQYTQAEYDAKVNWIGTMIAEGQVHIAGLTELGEDSESCISDVMTAANEKDITPWEPFVHEFRAKPSKGSTKIRTAVISRFELTNTESITTYPDGFRVDLHKPGTDADEAENWITVPSTQFNRPVARVTANPPNNAVPFNLFVVHLKSKRPTKAAHDDFNEAIGIARAAVRRNVEAAALRYYLDTFLPQQYEANEKVPTIAVGDFNDTPTSVPVENIRGPFDKAPGPSHPWTEVDKRRLISCARLHLKKSAYEDKLFSYVHNESFSLLDQAFVTEHLPGRFTRFEVYNDHVLRHQEASSPTDQEKQWKSMVSDHGVVVVEFTRMLKA
jgi:predicted extracellular nuclease